jgi:molecular chaperone IbpA
MSLKQEDMNPMRIDFSPFYRSTVGFDRLFNLLDSAASQVDAPAYPPYNIERTGENAYRITMAVAGFGENELNLETKEGVLTVTGRKVQDEEKRNFLHQGIAARSFERRFQLDEHVQVTGARLENGLLHVDLVREIPEAKRPRSIKIANGTNKPKAIEGEATKAA